MLSGWFAGDAWRLQQERRMFSFYLFIFANDPGGKYLLEGRARRGTNETRRPGGEGHPPGVSPLLPPACPEGCPGCARLGSSGGGGPLAGAPKSAGYLRLGAPLLPQPLCFVPGGEGDSPSLSHPTGAGERDRRAPEGFPPAPSIPPSPGKGPGEAAAPSPPPWLPGAPCPEPGGAQSGGLRGRPRSVFLLAAS